MELNFVLRLKIATRREVKRVSYRLAENKVQRSEKEQFLLRQQAGLHVPDEAWRKSSALVEGNMDHYTDDAIHKRKKLRKHPDVLALLDKIWRHVKKLHDQDDNHQLDFDEYKLVHSRITQIFAEDLSPDEMHRAMLQDWETDRKGDNFVDQEELLDSIFELTDTWVDSVELEDYTQFLGYLYDKMFSAAARWGTIKHTLKVRSVFSNERYRNFHKYIDHQKHPGANNKARGRDERYVDQQNHKDKAMPNSQREQTAVLKAGSKVSLGEHNKMGRGVNGSPSERRVAPPSIVRNAKSGSAEGGLVEEVVPVSVL